MNLIEAIEHPDLFQPWFKGPTWNNWKAILKAALALPLTDDELTFFRSVAERDPPKRRVEELWFCAGRRAGKDSVASAIAGHSAATFSAYDKIRRGERPLVACLATDRQQARIVNRYVHSYFTDIEELKPMLVRETQDGFELSNECDISVATSNHRAVRGRAILTGILDEVAFWRSEDSATPDTECYAALKPGLSSMPGSMLIGISTPYAKSGLLYTKYKNHYGQDSDDTLFIQAPTRALNPLIKQSVIDAAMAEDPARAQAEWYAIFRDDIAGYISRDLVLKCVTNGEHERPPDVYKHKYTSFTDPSGGSGDSMTCAIAHKEQDNIIVDVVREIRAPFDPESAVAEFSRLFKTYGMTKTHGDRYSAEWCRTAFERHGIEYRPAELRKSDLYRNLLPHLNSQTIRLVDNDRLVNQLASLERRTTRGSGDVVDHPQGGYDDISNSVAGVAFHTVDRARTPEAVFGFKYQFVR